VVQAIGLRNVVQQGDLVNPGLQEAKLRGGRVVHIRRCLQGRCSLSWVLFTIIPGARIYPGVHSIHFSLLSYFQVLHRRLDTMAALPQFTYIFVIGLFFAFLDAWVRERRIQPKLPV
jgi:hypothetical protein